MHETKLKPAAGVKAESTVRLEEEARQVIEEALTAAEAKSAVRARVKARDEIEEAESRVRAKAKAEARAKAIAEEDARIDAAGADQWFYMQNEVQLGPVTLSEMAEKVSDLSLEPPVRLVWTDGMDGWKPVYEVRKLCGPVQGNKPAQVSPSPSEACAEVAALSRTAADAQAAEEIRTAAATKAESDLRAAKATEEAKLRAMAEAKAVQEAQLHMAMEAKTREEAKTAAEARAKESAEEQARITAEAETKLKAAEAKAAAEARLREIAEARAAQETRLRAAVEAKAALEARIAAEASARAKAEEEARTKAQTEAKIKAAEVTRTAEAARESAEAKAESESKLRAAAEAKAENEAKLRAAAETKAAQESRTAAAEKSLAQKAARSQADENSKLRAAAEARADEETIRRTLAEKKALDESKLRAAAEAKVAAADAKAEDDKAMAEIEALAAQEAKVAEVAIKRARIKAKAAEEASIAAAAKVKARKEIRGKALENASIRVLAGAGAAKAEESKPKEPATTAEGAIPPAEQKAHREEPPEKPKSSKVSAKNGWFYTCEGDRLGPVSFEELRTIASNSTLDPRLDMVWRKSMDAWKPAGQIDGLFERSDVPVKSQESFADPAATVHPQPVARAPVVRKGPWPGARRRSLLIVALIFPLAWHYALGAAGPLIIKQFGQIMSAKFLPLATYLPLLLLVWFGWKRLTNLGMSHFWCLAIFAPILNLWVGYRCLACPAGYAYHKKLDAPGIALAVAYWLIMLLLAMFLVSLAAPLVNAIKNPALQKQVSSLISSVNQLGKQL